MVLIEYMCYLLVYIASNPILLLQTKKLQTLRYFQNFVGNSAEDGSLSLLMQIDVEILALQREATPPPQRRVDDFLTQSNWKPNLLKYSFDSFLRRKITFS